jgi:flagellar assembly protein FliH
MSEALARERMSAWQRWELASLAPPTHDAVATAQAEINAARTHAEAEGRREGLVAGRAQAATEREQLRALLAALDVAARQHHQQVADDLLDLALVIAQQLVGAALDVRRELVLPVLAQALKSLPAGTQRIAVALNPRDVALVEAFLHSDPTAPDCRLVADAAIEAGGCRVDADVATIDGTMTTRWRRILAALGRPDDWLRAD